jgi:hypothetical protein
MVLLTIAIALIVLSVVGSTYAQSTHNITGILNNMNAIRMKQVIDNCGETYATNGGNVSEPCYRFLVAFQKYTDMLFAETKDDVIKILVGP